PRLALRCPSWIQDSQRSLERNPRILLGYPAPKRRLDVREIPPQFLLFNDEHGRIVGPFDVRKGIESGGRDPAQKWESNSGRKGNAETTPFASPQFDHKRLRDRIQE